MEILIYKTLKNRKAAMLITIILIFSTIVITVKIQRTNTKKMVKENLLTAAREFLTEQEGFEFYNEKMTITLQHKDSLTLIFLFYKLELTKHNSFLDTRTYRIDKNNYGIRELKIYKGEDPSVKETYRI